MKKKVLFIATVLRGHMLVFHLPYMQWFQKQGYEVHCCAGNDTGESPAAVPNCDRYIEIAFERNPLHPKNRKAFRQLRALISREEYALIHCHTPVGGMLGRLAARKARRKGTAVCYTVHGFHFFSGAPLKNWFLYYTTERILARMTDLLVTINQEDFARASRFKAREVALVHGVGVDLTRFDTMPDRNAVRKEFAAGADTPVIITVGEHTKRKNHAACIRALKTIKDAVLVFCGVGQQEAMLRQLAEECRVAERVRFLGFRKDIPALLSAADIFLFPSLHEGLPVSLMEAMAAGLPCVISNVRGNTDLIRDGEGGFLYEPDDIAGFAEGLRVLIANKDLREQFGERNRAEVRKYGLPNVLGQMTALYEKQLAKRGDA
ncbi:MAG: glycosyltransferase family 4 protein [Bacillota bacterium]